MTTAAPLLALLVACSATSPSPASDDDDGGTSPDGAAGDDAATGDCMLPGDPFDAATLKTGIAFLASDALGGRSSGTPGDEMARRYIEDAFRCAGLAPGGPGGSYQQPFVAPDGTAATNVIGFIVGTDRALAPEVIMVGAHHDHLGVKAGQIYNGANDNASGTIAIIALARALRQQPPKRTVGFVAFGYEEHDGSCEGSEYYVRHAPPELAIGRVKYMVNLDMIGTYALANELTVYGTLAGTKGRTILDGLAPSYAGLRMTHSGNASADDSDFQAFADRAIPYVYFETWDEACYHKPCDDSDRIDALNTSRITKLAGDVLRALASGP